MQWTYLLAATLTAVAVSCGCSSCSNGSGDNPDSSVDTGTGTDSDADTDTDSDSDTDSECSHEGDWTWHDIPEGEDCGPGCTQLTFIDGLGIKSQKWDVWGEYLVYREEDSTQPHVVDIGQKKDLPIPPAITGAEYGSGGIAIRFPSVFGDYVYYGFKNYPAEPPYRGIARVAIAESCQQVLFLSSQPSDELNPFYHVDAYGEIFVSATTADAVDDRYDLVYLDAESPDQGLSTLITSEAIDYGFGNQIWGDHIVWTDTRVPPYNILGYNLTTEQFFEVAADEPHQFDARIWDGKVVYTDLRNGAGDFYYDWEHADIYLFDIATETTTRITDGEWIQCMPAIWEDTIVWSDYRDSTDPNDVNDFSGVEIYSYDIATEEEAKITDLPGRGKLYPKVFGNRVVFEMKDPQNDIQLYMVELAE